MEKKTRKTETLGIQSSQEGPLGYAESPYSRPGSLDRDTQNMEQLEYQYI